nr:MAG TPA: hypothetical protein [Caudoviricetes sp.]
MVKCILHWKKIKERNQGRKDTLYARERKLTQRARASLNITLLLWEKLYPLRG